MTVPALGMTEMLPARIADPPLAAYDVVVAHQGWDELLLFGTPVVLAILAVRWAERRGKARRDHEPTDELATDDVATDDVATDDLADDPPAPEDMPAAGGAEDDGPRDDVTSPPTGAGPTDPDPAAT